MKIAEALKNKILKYAQEFNKELGYIEPLKIEASGRQYFRVTSKKIPMLFPLMTDQSMARMFLLIGQMNLLLRMLEFQKFLNTIKPNFFTIF